MSEITQPEFEVGEKVVYKPVTAIDKHKWHLVVVSITVNIFHDSSRITYKVRGINAKDSKVSVDPELMEVDEFEIEKMPKKVKSTE